MRFVGCGDPQPLGFGGLAFECAKSGGDAARQGVLDFLLQGAKLHPVLCRFGHPVLGTRWATSRYSADIRQSQGRIVASWVSFFAKKPLRRLGSPSGFRGKGYLFLSFCLFGIFFGGVWGGGWVVGVLGGAGGEALVEICIASTLIFDTSPEGKVPKCGWRRTRAKRVHDRQTFHNDWGSLDPESPFVVTPGRPAAHAHSEPQPSRPRLNPELQAAKTEHHHRRKNS